MSCYYIYKEKQYKELDDLYPVLLGEMEAQESVVKVENGKETTVKINTELFPDKRNEISLASTNKIQELKPGVEEVFESNPELANEVYEALGFGKESKKEGWTTDGVKAIKRFKDGAAAIEFEVIKSDIVNSGNYSSNDVIFVSIGGKRGNEQIRKEQQDRTIKEALKAIEAGATLITDNKSYVESSTYNEGEKRLAKNLEAKGYNYLEQTVDGQVLGVWSKKTNSTQQDFESSNNLSNFAEEAFECK